MFDFIKNISPVELVIIALILILFLGSRMATKLAKTGGETFKEIKKIKKNITEAIEDIDEEPMKSKKEGGK